MEVYQETYGGLFMLDYDNLLKTIPSGRLGIIPLRGCEEMVQKIDNYIVNWRANATHSDAIRSNVAFSDYKRDSFIIKSQVPRFGSGEAKGIINETIRGDDLYLLVDITNHSLTYKLCGQVNHMSPDDHFSDLKRIIAAAAGKAKRVNVIMPFLYESRQDKRSSRESLDCALALQELVNMGVSNIITFDVHNVAVCNAIPLSGFESVRPTYQFIKSLLAQEKDLKISKDHLMVISPDEGAMNRSIYFANVLGVDVGMFYKRRDYATIVNGMNPIVAHEFLGDDISGKDVFILDDMISSGESILDVARQLKKRNCRKVFLAATFGLFTNGMEKFDKAYEEGIFDRVLTTNLTYQSPELLSRPYFINVDMSKYIALIIETLNHDASMASLLDPMDRIGKCIEDYNASQKQ
jgi:ribose-phosphate pyrophosphokinase